MRIEIELSPAETLAGITDSFEIIIAEDSSTDGTPVVLQSPGQTYPSLTS